MVAFIFKQITQMKLSGPVTSDFWFFVKLRPALFVYSIKTIVLFTTHIFSHVQELKSYQNSCIFFESVQIYYSRDLNAAHRSRTCNPKMPFSRRASHLKQLNFLLIAANSALETQNIRKTNDYLDYLSLTVLLF